jgi:hypothetical protein
MMTSIEISSVNLPGLVAWRTALDIRQVMVGFSRSLLFPADRSTDEHEQRERRELSVSPRTLVNRKIMPDKE